MTTAPRSRFPFLPLLIALAATLAAPLANAQWSVTDDVTHTKLDEGFNRFKVTPPKPPYTPQGDLFGRPTATSSSLEKEPANPDPQNWSTDGLKDIGKPCDGMAPNQQSICKEIANTRSAYYKYMKNMYDANIARYALLGKLYTERTNIGEKEFGRLQTNTNDILALQTLVTLDRQQMESVDHGYRMRIEFLTQKMTQQAKNLTSGTDPESGLGSTLGNAIAQGAANATLNMVLDNLTNEIQGQQKLGIDQ